MEFGMRGIDVWGQAPVLRLSEDEKEVWSGRILRLANIQVEGLLGISAKTRRMLGNARIKHAFGRNAGRVFAIRQYPDLIPPLLDLATRYPLHDASGKFDPTLHFIANDADIFFGENETDVRAVARGLRDLASQEEIFGLKTNTDGAKPHPYFESEAYFSFRERRYVPAQKKVRVNSQVELMYKFGYRQPGLASKPLIHLGDNRSCWLCPIDRIREGGVLIAAGPGVQTSYEIDLHRSRPGGSRYNLFAVKYGTYQLINDKIGNGTIRSL